MSYRILLPITTDREELVTTKLHKDIPDLERLILLNNWTDPKALELSHYAASKGAEVYHIPQNLGCGPSWNFGLRRMLEDKDDFLIILSPSAIFDHSILYFIDAIYNTEDKEPYARYIASPIATLHCFAITPFGVQLGGYWDGISNPPVSRRVWRGYAFPPSSRLPHSDPASPRQPS